ncbi:hypothetical protein [Sporosarcina beigongshangi]|uniref:hypothetical protein n=1 Tax=Sporosarcina beigongshangi TaxID=2782538 RepID=UPI001939E683|nr:hypothetical protein [Sporosarcina beigongshangi]
MKQDNDKLSESTNNEQQMGEDHMVVDNNKLKEMEDLQRKTDKDKLREKLLQESVKENYELLKRLSRT